MGKLDVSIKHAISTFPQHWAEFVGVQRGAPIRVVDTDVSTITGIADKVLLVEGARPFVLHLEPHGYYDQWLDDRVHMYNVLLRRRHGMFVHSVVIALNREAWGAANAGRVAAESPLGTCRIDFAYEVIKVWELPAERILTGGVGVLPLAPIADVPESELPQVIGRMAGRFDRELPRPEAAEFWTATYVLVGLKYDRVLAALLLRGVHDIMKESSTYQAIIEEGMAEGQEKGRVQGRVEGRVEGKREDLLLLGTRRFGAPDAELLAEINAIVDPARLDAMLVRILDASGWNDVLAD